MLQSINIELTKKEPGVIFDQQANRFEIWGRSIPENAASFFQPLKDWISNYITNPNASTVFVFKLEYLNSSSTKQILRILAELEKLFESNHEVKIIWCYETDDDVMRERGEELESVVQIPFIYETF